MRQWRFFTTSDGRLWARINLKNSPCICVSTYPRKSSNSRPLSGYSPKSKRSPSTEATVKVKNNLKRRGISPPLFLSEYAQKIIRKPTQKIRRFFVNCADFCMVDFLIKTSKSCVRIAKNCRFRAHYIIYNK